MAKRPRPELFEDTEHVDRPTNDRPTRLLLALDDSGNIAWDRMQDKTRAAARRAIQNDPTLQVSAGSSAPPVTDMLPPAAMGALVDAWAQITILVAMRWADCSRRDAALMMTYSASEKAQVADPLARVVNKYAPAVLSKYADEITLALILTTITQNKLLALRDLLDHRATGGPVRMDRPIHGAGIAHEPVSSEQRGENDK
jgi:hypothetical protein